MTTSWNPRTTHPAGTGASTAGAGFDRPDDDDIAERTAQERVDTGVADYNPDSVLPATDTPTTADSSEYQEAEAEADRQVDAGELGPGPEREAFPPTHYDRT